MHCRSRSVFLLHLVKSRKKYCTLLPVFGLQVVQGVVKSLVELSLSNATENAKGKNSGKKIQHPVERQIERQPIVPDSVQDPGSSPGAQVKLGREDIVLSISAGALEIYLLQSHACMMQISKVDKVI